MGIIGDPTEQKEHGWFVNRFVELRNFREAVTVDMDDTLARSSYVAGMMLGIKGVFMLASTLALLMWKPIELALWDIPLDETHLMDSLGSVSYTHLTLPTILLV